MPVKHYDTPNHARFLTYSCFNRLPLLDTPEIRDLYLHEIAKQSVRLRFDVIAYVIMPDHVHLIVVPHDGKISAVLRGLKQGFGREMIERYRREDTPILQQLVGPHGRALFWQRGGGYDRNLRSSSDIREKIEYIHQNPVRRGITEKSTDWVWSSANDFAGVPGVVPLRREW